MRFLWAKNMDAAKDIHKEMLPIWAELSLCERIRIEGKEMRIRPSLEK
jgi:hypothetical protein